MRSRPAEAHYQQVDKTARKEKYPLFPLFLYVLHFAASVTWDTALQSDVRQSARLEQQTFPRRRENVKPSVAFISFH